ncbi:unnamed protein product [Gordionus sp. m RMFG-2023]
MSNDLEPEIQKICYKLRNNFLKAIIYLKGKPTIITFPQKLKQKGDLLVCDTNVRFFCISNFETPIGIVPYALIIEESEERLAEDQIDELLQIIQNILPNE